jgi:very-short-patch-repair endonuclease
MTDRSMFYGAKPHIFEKTNELRSNMTKAEKLLWNKLQNNKILGLRFKSQHPIDTYIADFYCHRLKLVIEVDGGIHSDPENAEYDIGRSFEMNNFDIKVIRFKNKEIEAEIENVIKVIESICKERTNEGMDDL